jgi:hypothetical protein
MIGVGCMIRSRIRFESLRQKVVIEYRLRRENERLMLLQKYEEEDDDEFEEPPKPPIPPKPPEYLSRQKLIPISQSPNQGFFLLVFY